MKSLARLSLLALLLPCACQKSLDGPDGKWMTIGVQSEGSDGGKLSIEEDGGVFNLLWSGDETMTVSHSCEANRTSTFNMQSHDGRYATFAGALPGGASGDVNYIGVVSSFGSSATNTARGAIAINQDYNGAAIAQNCFLVARADNCTAGTAPANWKLLTMNAFLKFSITQGDGPEQYDWSSMYLTSIVVEAIGREYIAGRVGISKTDPNWWEGYAEKITEKGNSSTSVTLNCITGDHPRGVALGNVATAFYLAIEFGTYSKGLKVSFNITDAQGKEGKLVKTISKDKEYAVARNQMRSLKTFALSPSEMEGQSVDPTPPPVPPTPVTVSGWLELPAYSAGDPNLFYGTFRANTTHGDERNYTYLYDKTTFTSYWVAYPLYAACIGGERHDGWHKNENLVESEQINIWSSSYGVNVGSTSSEGYDEKNNYYARGHQIPDADRSGIADFQYQTYVATNSTPQIQNKFNSGIWNTLESAVRGCIPLNDTLYVITGAALKTAGQSEPVTYIKPKSDDKSCPVPNYYWKALLKVKRGSGETITGACAIAFWIQHYEHTDGYANYACSVDDIEANTGFDLFTNLPQELQATAESNSSWSGFQSF